MAEKLVTMGYRFRLYPTPAQARQIDRTLGCARWVYNKALESRIAAREAGAKTPGYSALCKMLTSWKGDPTTCWLREADSMALQQALRDLMQAYDNFFASCKGERSRTSFPRFKSKRAGLQSYRTNCNGSAVRVEDARHVVLPKLGRVKARVSRDVRGRILSATVVRTPTGKYFCSLLAEGVPIEQRPASGGPIGVDLGIAHEVVTSNGEAYQSPKALKRSLKKLKHAQRSLSRKKRGSANYGKQRKKVARVHERVANQRRDFINKLTTRLVRENQAVCAESLNVRGMMKNHRLARSLGDAGLGEVLRQLEYKSAWYGRAFVQVDRFYPSSKTCSKCGHVQEMPLSVRTYECPVCGMSIDRDLNAAINIRDKVIRKLGWDTPEVKACGEVYPLMTVKAV